MDNTIQKCSAIGCYTYISSDNLDKTNHINNVEHDYRLNVADDYVMQLTNLLQQQLQNKLRVSYSTQKDIELQQQIQTLLHLIANLTINVIDKDCIKLIFEFCQSIFISYNFIFSIQEVIFVVDLIVKILQNLIDKSLPTNMLPKEIKNLAKTILCYITGKNKPNISMVMLSNMVFEKKVHFKILQNQLGSCFLLALLYTASNIYNEIATVKFNLDNIAIKFINSQWLISEEDKAKLENAGYDIGCDYRGVVSTIIIDNAILDKI
jgi:hypothetical protein